MTSTGGEGDDDWFAEAPASFSYARGGDETVEDDDWLYEEARPRAPRRHDLPPVLRSRNALLVGGGILLVFVLLIGLLVGGVFSSSSPPAVSTPITTATPPVTTTQTKPAVVVAVPTTTLKPGDTGAQVKLLQKALTAVGNSPGKADGNYGPATSSALEDFQRSAKLTADGIFGPATKTALAKAVRAL
jgi:hypothetical protein